VAKMRCEARKNSRRYAMRSPNITELLATTGRARCLKRIDLVLQTSNIRKLAEVNRFGLAVRAAPGADLKEVDGTPEEVVMYKALAAGPGVLVEDTSLDVEGYNAGVNIRWLLATLKEHIRAAEKSVAPAAVWRVMFAVHHDNVMYLAQAEVKGHMVAEPRGAGFSFDAHFVPEGHHLTLGEMEATGTKDLVSARKAAVTRLLAGHCRCRAVDEIPAWTGAYQAEAV
jgi:inosine/xanthosine triphosphate pyrophosphatase family protein